LFIIANIANIANIEIIGWFERSPLLAFSGLIHGHRSGHA